MVSNAIVHEEFDRRAYRQISFHGRDLDVISKDSYVNEAYRTWFKNRVALAQTSSKVRFDIKDLLCSDVLMNCRKVDEEYCLYQLPPDYYSMVRQRIVATKSGCSKERNLIVHTLQSDDWEETVKDPHWKPSFEWEETIGIEQKNGFKLALGDFCVKKVVIDYYRLPKPMYSPSLSNCGYSFGGESIASDSKFELDMMQLDEILDLAIVSMQRDGGDLGDFKSMIDKNSVTNQFPNKGI